MIDRYRTALELVGILGIEIGKDGNQWSYLFGSNIQEGVCGFGDTPMMATIDFCNNFFNENIIIVERVDDELGGAKKEIERLKADKE